MRWPITLGAGGVLCLILMPPMAWAQGTSAASVAGTVKDTSGAVLPGVTVEAASPALIEKVRSTVSDDKGEYRITELRSGENDGAGQTYAIFIQDANGARPAMQVTDCNWNIQHPKWFPPREDGKTLLIAAVQAPGQPFRIATFDVSRFVGGAH